jgi:pilus assembly protein CpaE
MRNGDCALPLDTNAPPEAPPTADAGRLALAFVSDEETAAAVRKCFIDLTLIAANVERAGIDTAIAALHRVHSPRVLIVDISGLDDPLAHLRRLAEVCDPSTAVMVIGERNDIVLYRSLKTLGVAEYFFKPVVPELLERACQAVIAGTASAAETHTGKLVAVFGVRGGVGTSTIAVNTAWHLAEALHRHVALLDLDLRSGDAALQLDIEPSHALREALEHPERIDDLLLARAVTKVTDRLSVLASLEPLTENFVAKEDAALQLIANLQARHRYVFVDVPHWGGAQLRKIIEQASVVLLVGDPTLASAREMVRWRDIVKSTGPDHAVWQILNKAGAPGALPVADFARVLGEALDVVVPFDGDVAKSANLGHPALPKCRSLLHGLAPLFRSLSGEAAQPHLSFFARLFQP